MMRMGVIMMLSMLGLTEALKWIIWLRTVQYQQG